MPRSRQSRGLSVPGPERAGRRHVILPHSYASARPFTLDDARFMEAVSHVIAGALDREASEQELRRRALEDPLTGLANRALLSQQLEAQLRHARRLGDHVSVLPRPGRSSSAASRPCVVLAAEITNTSTDFSQLDPMVTATLNELQRIGHTELPEAVVADAGYWNERSRGTRGDRG